MCYSATASFVAGTALTAIGVVTLNKTKSKKEIPLAIIPILFGIQQIVEGLTWLSFGYKSFSFINPITTYAFVIFAYVLWPIWVPFSIGAIETKKSRKKILFLFQIIGIFVSLYLLNFIITNQIASQVINKCISYTMPNQYGIVILSLYLLATSISCLFSSKKIINILGATVTISLAIAYYFYTSSFVSIWCFFAAILSFITYLYFHNRK